MEDINRMCVALMFNSWTILSFLMYLGTHTACKSEITHVS